MWYDRVEKAKMVKSACGIEAVYMRFNGTGIWGGETFKCTIFPTSRLGFCDVVGV